MKAKLILIVILMTAIPVLSSAQTISGADSAPTNLAGTPDSQQVLQEYDAAMVAITQNFSAKLEGITEAVQQRKMSSEEGRTSSAEHYLIAQMQFQLLLAHGARWRNRIWPKFLRP